MAKPFFPWMGNKEKLVPYIHKLIPPHVKQFTEVFGGSGAVILGLQPKKGRLDIYNDLNYDLFNVFCCVKEKSFSLAKELKFLPVHGRTPFAFYRDMAAHEPDFYRHIEEEKRVVAESTCFTEEEIRELLTILDGNAKLFDVRRAAAFLFTTYGSFSGTGNSVGIKTVDPQAIVDKLQGSVLPHKAASGFKTAGQCFSGASGRPCADPQGGPSRRNHLCRSTLYADRKGL